MHVPVLSVVPQEDEGMSDIMLFGVLEMPPYLWHSDPIDIAQRHGRYKQAAQRIREDEEKLAAKDAEIAELRAQVEELKHSLKMEHSQSGSAQNEGDEARECVRRLQRSAQAVLDRWNSPTWQWHGQGPTADLMNTLRETLASTPEHLR